MSKKLIDDARQRLERCNSLALSSHPRQIDIQYHNIECTSWTDEVRRFIDTGRVSLTIDTRHYSASTHGVAEDWLRVDTTDIRFDYTTRPVRMTSRPHFEPIDIAELNRPMRHWAICNWHPGKDIYPAADYWPESEDYDL